MRSFFAPAFTAVFVALVLMTSPADARGKGRHGGHRGMHGKNHGHMHGGHGPKSLNHYCRPEALKAGTCSTDHP